MEQYLSKFSANLQSKTDWSAFLDPQAIEAFLKESEKLHHYYYILEQEYLDREKAKTLTKEAPNQMLANLLLKATEMQTLRPHAIQLLNCLCAQKKIDLPRLRKLSFQFGIPDEVPGLRVTVWRIFLGLLPLDTQEWETSLETNYSSYQVYVKEMIERHKLFQFSDAEDPYRLKTEGMPEEEQKERKENAKILRMVEKDIKRTRQELSFFRQAIDPMRNIKAEDLDRLERQHRLKRTDLQKEDVSEYIWTHSDSLARILYLYAKLNKAFVYVQGMNEILAVIYYCFWKDNDPDLFDQQQVESDVFMCFSNLMAEIGDGFMLSFDTEQGGLFEKCKKIDNILRQADQTVWIKLRELNCDTKFFAIRWVMVLLCQDLEMPDCIRIWDTLLADERRFEFLEYISAAIVLRHRTLIIRGDFARVCTCLQEAAKNIADIPILIKEAH